VQRRFEEVFNNVTRKVMFIIIIKMKYFWKCKSNSITALEGPRGFQEVKVPRFHDNGTGWW
jgi:hypothetical protein